MRLKMMNVSESNPGRGALYGHTNTVACGCATTPILIKAGGAMQRIVWTVLRAIWLHACRVVDCEWYRGANVAVCKKCGRVYSFHGAIVTRE